MEDCNWPSITLLLGKVWIFLDFVSAVTLDSFSDLFFIFLPAANIFAIAALLLQRCQAKVRSVFFFFLCSLGSAFNYILTCSQNAWTFKFKFKQNFNVLVFVL